MSKFVAESFTNDHDQIVSPGDDILCVTVSTSRVSVRRGIFAGVVRNDDGNITCYRWLYKPGYRYDQQGFSTCTYSDGRTFEYPNYVKVEDPNYTQTQKSYLGRIYRVTP